MVGFSLGNCPSDYGFASQFRVIELLSLSVDSVTQSGQPTLPAIPSLSVYVFCPSKNLSDLLSSPLPPPPGRPTLLPLAHSPHSVPSPVCVVPSSDFNRITVILFQLSTVQLRTETRGCSLEYSRSAELRTYKSTWGVTHPSNSFFCTLWLPNLSRLVNRAYPVTKAT